MSEIAALKDGLQDQFWRLNNLYWIQDEKGNRVRFQMRPAQYELIKNRWWLNFILKSRQHGMSTVILIFMLDCAFWYPDVAAGCIAHTLGDVKKLFRTKVKYPYEKLPPEIKALNPAKFDSANELVFENGSSMYVGTSLRSSTLQLLHISEYAKVCAKYPDKALEIQSGALNTVHEGATVFIEGTAEGRGNDFHARAVKAQKLRDKGSELTRLDYKFFFFPWWHDAKNALSEEVSLTAEEEKYFAEMKLDHDIDLTQDQKSWYAKKARDLGSSMFREHPTTPSESFWATQEGSIYGKVMAKLRKNKQIISRIPIEPNLPVYTCWDLGKNDENAIWFFQKGPEGFRFIKYYENTGEGLNHYAKVLSDFKDETGCVFAQHYLPHDAGVSDLSISGKKTREEVLNELGVVNTVIVPRVTFIQDGIETTRNFLHRCWFSEHDCTEGVEHLENYMYETDARTGSLKDTPRHTKASNAADAIRQAAQGFTEYTSTRSRRRRVSTAAV